LIGNGKSRAYIAWKVNDDSTTSSSSQDESEKATDNNLLKDWI